MKSVTLLLGLVLASPLIAGEIAWVKDFDTATQQAAKSGKIIMVDFYTDWCGWCKRLDRDTYSSEKVIGLANKLVSVKVNAEKEGVELARKHAVRGFPTILFVSAAGKEIGRIGGYLPADPFADEMKQILAQAESSSQDPGNAKPSEPPKTEPASGGAELAWVKSYDEALKAAAASKKVVMIDFFTDWCVWCKRLDQDTYSDKQVAEFAAQKLVPLKLDAEKEGAELAKKNNVSGYPTILFLSGQGEVVGRIGGYMKPEPFLAEVKKILATAEELPEILATLKSNPDDGPANAKFVKFAAMRGDNDAAVKSLERAEKAGVSGDLMGDAFNAVGDLYQGAPAASPAEALPNLEKAIGYFTKGAAAAKSNQTKAYSRISIMFCYLQSGQNDKAKALAEELGAWQDLPAEYKEMVERVRKAP